MDRSTGGPEFGIGIPQIHAGARTDVDGLHRFLRRAEELGFASAWVMEQPIGSAGLLEPLALLAHAAAVTTRLRLGVAVILAPLRPPVALAKALATVDQLSGGRLIAGLALGGREHYPAFGLSSDRRTTRFEEAVRLLKLLWELPSVTFEGEFWTLSDVAVEPKPVQRPHPPIWFGGGHPSALVRAARTADGWIGAGSSGTEEFASSVPILREALEGEGRDPSSFPVAKRVYVAVDDDTERARARLHEWFGRVYGNPGLADRVAVFGSAEVVAEGLTAVAGAGAGLIVANPVFDQEQQAETLASNVVPQVRQELAK